jgi:prolipoprotein diacylglyceryltransferase
MVFLIYASLYAVGRFGLDFLRGDETAIAGPFHQAQVISLIVMVIAIPLLIWLARRPAPKSVEAD